MESTGTKPKQQTGGKGPKKKCTKQVKLFLTEDEKISEVKYCSSKENVDWNYTDRSIDVRLKSNKSNPITLQKNTLLKVEKKIKDTEKQKFKPYTNSSELPPNSLITFEEKITKKLNFPAERKLYKQLISLNRSEKLPTQFVPVSYEPAVRDREPKLETYYNPNFAPEKPIPVPINFPSHSCTRTFSAYRNYQIMKSWEES